MKIHSVLRLNRTLPLALALAAFGLLALESGPAAQAAEKGLDVCTQVIIPSLLPFFVLSNLLSAMGLSRALNRLATPVMKRLFRISGAGAAAFLIGLTGGYPLGANLVADLYRRKELKEMEARKLLCFCNNSGPAFIIGAAGSAVFGSAAAGFTLYGAHILAAVLCGLVFSRLQLDVPGPCGRSSGTLAPVERFSAVFPKAVAGAVTATLSICGFVIFFSVVVGVLDALGIFSFLAEALSLRTGLDMTQSRALLTGLLELGSGVSALRGLPLNAGNMALAAFLLGWGGLSVQFQTLSVLSGTTLSKAPLIRSKLLHGLLSAGIAFGIWSLLS